MWGECLLEFINTSIVVGGVAYANRSRPFQADAYNFQSISAVGEKVVWPRETSAMRTCTHTYTFRKTISVNQAPGLKTQPHLPFGHIDQSDVIIHIS